MGAESAFGVATPHERQFVFVSRMDCAAPPGLELIGFWIPCYKHDAPLALEETPWSR
jgi:hypothetical protein